MIKSAFCVLNKMQVICINAYILGLDDEDNLNQIVDSQTDLIKEFKL